MTQSSNRREVVIARKVTAHVISETDVDRISFSASSAGRRILLGALQGKVHFLKTVESFDARVVWFVDGVDYVVPSHLTDQFVAEVSRLVEQFIREMPDRRREVFDEDRSFVVRVPHAPIPKQNGRFPKETAVLKLVAGAGIGI